MGLFPDLDRRRRGGKHVPPTRAEIQAEIGEQDICQRRKYWKIDPAWRGFVDKEGRLRTKVYSQA
jgi:hypothetical protein